jgi:hypothetical protein
MGTPIQEALKTRKGLGRKFEVADVVANYKILHQAAVDYLHEYGGDFEFLLQMQEELEKSDKLSAGQVKGVLNCLAADRNYKVDETPSEGTPYIGDELVPVVPNGTYTVVDNDSRTTIRVKDCKFGDFPPGTQVAEFLSGPDNEADYTGFAFVQGSVVKIWTRYKGSEKLKRAMDILMRPGKYKEAGEQYAIKSNRCWRCNRKLTVPTSVHRGLGPECAGVVNDPRNGIVRLGKAKE